MLTDTQGEEKYKFVVDAIGDTSMHGAQMMSSYEDVVQEALIRCRPQPEEETNEDRVATDDESDSSNEGGWMSKLHRKMASQPTAAKATDSHA